MKKILLLLVSAIMLFGCKGAEASKAEAVTDKGMELADYKEMVSKCHDDIMEQSVLLSNLGKYEYNFWKASNSVNGNVDSEKLTTNGYRWLAENGGVSGNDLESSYQDIKSQCTEIVKSEVVEDEAISIKDAFESLYQSYDALYNLTTSPSGGIDDFANEFNTHSEAVQSYDAELCTLLAE